MDSLECDRITRYVLPAVRISVAEGLKERYSMNQQQIAAKLGVAQVAVSKYLNGRYSTSVKKIRNYINSNNLADEVCQTAALSSNSNHINSMIDKLCTNIIDNKL